MRKQILALAATAALSIGAMPAMAATYNIDPTHTFVTFEIDHHGTSTNRGRFDNIEGTIEYDPEARTGKADITVQVGSVSTGTPAFDKHLLADDILDVAKFATARFVSTEFDFDDGKLDEVKGELTLMGQTHPVTLEAEKFNCYKNQMMQGREVCGGDFEVKIDRSKWGVDYGIKNGGSKEVKLIIQIEAVRAS